MDLRQRTLWKSWVNRPTIIPSTIGFSLILMTLLADLSGTFGFAGFLGVLIGAGIGMTNVIVFGDKFTAQVSKEIRDEERAEKNRMLDELAVRLGKDDDRRDDRLLADIRRIYDDFSDDLDEGRVSSYIGDGIKSQVEELLQHSIRSLDDALTLAETAETLRGARKEAVLKDRTAILREVRQGVDDFGSLVAGVRGLGLKAKTEDLGKVRDELTRSLRVALRVEDRMRDLKNETTSSFE